MPGISSNITVNTALSSPSSKRAETCGGRLNRMSSVDVSCRFNTGCCGADYFRGHGVGKGNRAGEGRAELAK